LRDDAIAFAISKERLTREKHDTGFYQELAAEGISLNEVDLVVRNCYVLPVEDLEIRMLSQDVRLWMTWSGSRRQSILSFIAFQQGLNDFSSPSARLQRLRDLPIRRRHPNSMSRQFYAAWPLWVTSCRSWPRAGESGAPQQPDVSKPSGDRSFVPEADWLSFRATRLRGKANNSHAG
jgi:hypothetical protein